MPRVGFQPIFARRVEEPLARAKVELGAGRVKEALEALDPRTLGSSLDRAIDDVARASGATKAEVKALVEWAPIDLAIASLSESRAAAAAAWGELPPIAGGLLEGVAEVTTHAGNDDVGFYLDRLGQKMSRDRSLAGPIDTLAADVEGWQTLMASTGQALDAHPKLLAARQRRTLRAILIVVGIAAVVVPLTILSVLRARDEAAAKARVEAALDGTDPCAASGIAAADLVIAGPAARERASERTRTCGEIRERAVRVSQCEALVSAVEQRRPLEGEAGEQAGSKRALLDRMIARNLEAIDLQEAPAWPCEEVDGSRRLWRVFVEAAGASTGLWREPLPIAGDVVARIAEVGLPQAARGTLLASAEEVSGHGVRQGDASSLTRGAELCSLCRKLRIETAGNCKGLDVVLAKAATSPP